ncbi:MAG TPA: hypothetical protein VHW96_18270 [Solirubrobacteraceae bacterium]|nr:hypothetical protein [Solirubrobacteraceae bacterium]
MRRGRLITLLTVVALAAPAAALASGAPTPSVSASVGVAGARAGSDSLELAITRNGTVVYRRPVTASGCRGHCMDVAVPPGKSPLHVLDLDGNGEPEVVLGLFTGGANCCFIDQVLSFDPATKTYVKAQHNFLNAGAALARLDGHWVLRSGDSRITEAGFTDTADSGTPIQVWRFAGRAFTDVTRRYPKLIRADAAMWMRLFNHHLSNGVGLIAAWAADQDLLGHSAMVDTTLRSFAAQNKLRTPLGLPHGSETQFVTQLEKLLHRLGYTH